MDAAERHRRRLLPYVEPHLARRERGVKHPVHDFMFEYYAYRPSKLLRWYEPIRLVEQGVERPSVETTGTRLTVSTDAPAALLDQPMSDLIHRTLTLLKATAARTPNLGCFGLHEWAMVHRSEQHGTRHAWPLRLGASGTDEVVEGHRIGCSHFDAFRFFTPSAKPLNVLQPGRDDRADFEQPGCLHATMDLYKHSFRLAPLVSAELVADAFLLAWDVRVLDMRAAPYDLTGVTLDPTGEAWTPVRIETTEGRREYAAAQSVFAERAAAVRQRLVDELDALRDE